MNFARTVLFLLAACVVAASPRAEQVELQAFETLDIRAEFGPGRTRVPIRAFGRRFVMEVAPNRGLLASLPAPQRRRIADGDLFLTGTLEGLPGSWVRLNRIDGRFSGGMFDGNELYLIDRAAGFSGMRSRGLRAAQTIVFRFGDLDFSTLVDHGGVEPGDDPGTATKDGSVEYETFVEHLREVVTLQGTAMLAVPLTVVSDVQFSNRHGGNTASVVAGRVNFIDGIYSSQVGTGITLLHHEILTDNDVLVATDAADLLVGRFNGNTLVQPGFRQFMRTGAGSSLPFEGLAHLFTGRNLDGSTVGIAFLGVLCSRSAGYGVDQDLTSDTTSALVLAHEVGHNFNAPHDGDDACASETFRGIMNPSINGSQQFSQCSLAQMAPEVASASCLAEAFDGQAVFGDGFE